MRIIYQKVNVAEVYVENDYIVANWKNMSDKKAFYEGVEKELEEVKKGNIKAIIVNLEDARSTPPKEINEWLVRDVFPVMAAVPQFKAMINTVPSSAITRMGLKSWYKKEGSLGFDLYEAKDLDSSKALVKTL